MSDRPFEWYTVPTPLQNVVWGVLQEDSWWNISAEQLCSGGVMFWTAKNCLNISMSLAKPRWLRSKGEFFVPLTPPPTPHPPIHIKDRTRVWCELKMCNNKAFSWRMFSCWTFFFFGLAAGRTMMEGWPHSCPAPSLPLCRPVWDQGRSTLSTWWPSGTRGGASQSLPLSQHVGGGRSPQLKNLATMVGKNDPPFIIYQWKCIHLCDQLEAGSEELSWLKFLNLRNNVFFINLFKCVW